MALYKEMTDESLRNAYWGERENLYNWDQMMKASHSTWQRNKVSGKVNASLRRVSIMEAIAKKRGISLRKPVSATQDAVKLASEVKEMLK